MKSIINTKKKKVHFTNPTSENTTIPIQMKQNGKVINQIGNFNKFCQYSLLLENGTKRVIQELS